MDQAPDPPTLSIPITPARVWLRFVALAVVLAALDLWTYPPLSFGSVFAGWFLVVAIIVRLRAPRSIGFHASGISIERPWGSRFVPWSEIESIDEDLYDRFR